MKKISYAGPVLVGILNLLFSGCSSPGTSFVAILPPPSEMNCSFLRYRQAPGQKAFVLAVDPAGQWAYGYSYAQETVEEATAKATETCDKARRKYGVVRDARPFAVNDEVVYYDPLEKTHR
ncbi:MAG: hypothetical protein AB7E95_04825 [Kiritimatiellales bacterium]